MNVKTYKAIVRGHQSKESGEMFEKLIEAACRYYSQTGEAEIEKTPEPMRPIRRLKNGQFVAVFTKKAQPDYKGTLKTGQSIVFEAKHTDTGRLRQSVVTDEQEKRLDRHFYLGAECYVLVSFGFQRFYKIPWYWFKDMKNRTGRSYIMADDSEIKKYEVHFIGGVLCFLSQ